jgi:hypothetical protein
MIYIKQTAIEKISELAKIEKQQALMMKHFYGSLENNLPNLSKLQG